MTIPFTAFEIRKEIVKLKPSKSPGYDEIPDELIKCAPETIHKQIVEYTTPCQKQVIHQEK